MLNNSFGVYLYLILRNDYSWAMLSPAERQLIAKANQDHNTQRDDYKTSEKYGEGRMEGGENWDSQESRSKSERGRALLSALETIRPKRVLEIGPGAGFFTKAIAEFPSVEHYTALDIGQSFLDYLSPRLEKVKAGKPFTYTTHCGELAKYSPNEKFDFIVLLSSIHHIPDRPELFSLLKKHLVPGGHIFCFDPAHYLPRLVRLSVKFFTKGYFKKEKYRDGRTLSTHHFCTRGEFKKVFEKVGGLEIEKEYYVYPSRFKSHLRPQGLSRFLANDMGLLVRKA